MYYTVINHYNYESYLIIILLHISQFQRQSHSQAPLPMHFFNQFVEQGLPQSPPQYRQEAEEDESNNNFNNLGSTSPLGFGPLGIPPHLIPIVFQQSNNNIEESSQNSPSGLGPIFMQPEPAGIRERERASPHPLPIMPRAHFQHGQFFTRMTNIVQYLYRNAHGGIRH